MLKYNKDKPSDIPNAPNQVYRNKGWTSYRDWLGLKTETLRTNYLSYDESKKLIENKNISSLNAYKSLVRSGRLNLKKGEKSRR